MPAIGRERLTNREVTLKEVEQEEEISQKARDIHDTMRAITLTPQTRRLWRVFTGKPDKSIVAVYELPEGPNHVRMTALLEDFWGSEIVLKTQAVSILDGKPSPLEEVNQQAHTDGEGLGGWQTRAASDSHDDQLDRLVEVAETVTLITQAEEQRLARLGACGLSFVSPNLH
jgi:hypothetical protein